MRDFGGLARRDNDQGGNTLGPFRKRMLGNFARPVVRIFVSRMLGSLWGGTSMDRGNTSRKSMGCIVGGARVALKKLVCWDS